MENLLCIPFQPSQRLSNTAVEHFSFGLMENASSPQASRKESDVWLKFIGKRYLSTVFMTYRVPLALEASYLHSRF